MTPDYLVIGHLSKDLRPHGEAVAGGTVLYAALTAERLGAQAALVTALAAADGSLLNEAAAEGIWCVVNPSRATTTFSNNYQGEARQQIIHAQAAPLRPEQVPAAWRAAPIVHLGPVARELTDPASWPALFPNALIAVTPQGWLRAWGDEGLVRPAPWHQAAAILPACHVLVMSLEDTGGDSEQLQQYVNLAPLAVITAGSAPASIYEQGRLIAQVPACRTQPVDYTGAGDVFTAAFLLAYKETGDPLQATRFAHAAAACAIEGEGTAGIASRAVVETRLGRVYDE